MIGAERSSSLLQYFLNRIYLFHMVEKLRQVVEYHVLELIKKLTSLGKMTQEQAQSMAQHVLNVLKPGMSLEEFFRGAFKLDDGFPELSAIVLPLARLYHEKVDNPTTEHVRRLVHEKHYDEAVSLAHKLVSQEITLKLRNKSQKI